MLRLYRQLYPELDLRADAAVAAAWATTLATPRRTVLLAEVGGAVVGTADLTVLANTARAGRTCWWRTSSSTGAPAAPAWDGRC